ncbi:MAG TPA: substrate-binding domain-containing protein [Solirubrobacterales bacterium]
MRRTLLAAAALVALLAALAGCGVSSKDVSGEGGQGAVEGGTAKPAAETNKVPPRPAGSIRLEGVTPGSLPAKLLTAYQEQGTLVRFESGEGDESEGFAALCAGRTDIVSSQAPIAPSVYAACQENGVEPVQIEIASDAAILAIANETNVGVDCLSASDVREIFRAASPVSSWTQVGYGRSGIDTPLKVAGPEPSSGLLSSFSDLVFGDPEPSRLLLRGDYQAHREESEVLDAVAGDQAEAELAGHRDEISGSAKGLAKALKQAEKAVEVAEFQVEKGIEDERSEAEQEADAETLSEAEEKVAPLAKELEETEVSVAEDKAASKKVEARFGTLGLFRFGFYELWEERLRPMEVESTNSESKPECIFPSQATVTEATYPLAHQLLLTVNLKTMKEAEVSQFLDFVLSESQEAATAETMVPLPEEIKDTELAWLDGEVAPDVIFYPASRIAETESRANEGEAS